MGCNWYRKKREKNCSWPQDRNVFLTNRETSANQILPSKRSMISSQFINTLFLQALLGEDRGGGAHRISGFMTRKPSLLLDINTWIKQLMTAIIECLITSDVIILIYPQSMLHPHQWQLLLHPAYLYQQMDVSYA